MQFSFIIPAYNEEQYLEATIQTIISSCAPINLDYEIIVVNDNSSDATLAIAERLNAKTITVHNRKISATRNDGAKIAKGEILVFVDADTHVNTVLLKAMLKALENQQVVGGGGSVVFDSAPLYARMMTTFAMILFSMLKYAAGCFIFCRKSAYETIGGFDENFYYTEELDFSKKMKKIGKFVILKEHVVTSGRKLKTYSFWQTMKIIFVSIIHNPKSAKSHAGKEYWYKQRGQF